MAKPAKKTDKQRCVTPVARISFPSLWKATKYQENEPKFQCTLLFGKNADLTELKRTVSAAKRLAWGEDKTKWPKKIESPFRDGNDKEDLEGYKGTIYVVAKNKYKPQVKDRDGATDIIEGDNKIQAGDYARFILRAFPYGGGYKGSTLKAGIAFSLDGVQFHSQGKRFSGMPDASEYFDAMEDEEDDEGNYEESDESEDEDEDDEDTDW